MRRFKKRRSKLSLVKKIFILIVFLTAFTFSYFELQVRPKITDLTRVKAEILATEAINKAVIEQLDVLDFTYDDLVNVDYKSDNTVGSISTNMIEMNRLKSAVSVASQNKINELYQKEICFKAGDLSGFDLLSGRGPDVVVKLNFSGSIMTDFKSSFQSAGLNQTKHTVSVIVTANIYITSESLLKTTSEITTTVPVAETVIVGSVPSFYAQKAS